MDESDADLLAATVRGDAEAFGRFYRRHEHRDTICRPGSPVHRLPRSQQARPGGSSPARPGRNLETSWYRWVTVAMLAWPSLALTEHAQPPLAGMIPLTRNEIAGVAAAPYQPARW